MQDWPEQATAVPEMLEQQIASLAEESPASVAIPARTQLRPEQQAAGPSRGNSSQERGRNRLSGVLASTSFKHT
jgi:hypothetical protein